MLRGFLTTFGVVSAIALAAWAYTDQNRMASAVPHADVTPHTQTATTTSNLAAKGDRLTTGELRLSGAGAMDRIIAAHAQAMEANANSAHMTVAVPSGHNETTLTRIPVEP